MVFEHSAAQQALPDTAEEAALFEHLSAEPVHVDALCRATGLSSQEVSSTLTLLELKGIVRQVGGMNYVMVREADPAYEVNPDDVSPDNVRPLPE
jgi:DNA processing protein